MKANKNLIIQKITGLSKEQLFLKNTSPLTPLPLQGGPGAFLTGEGNLIEYKKALLRLEKGEPIEYILENAEFYGLDFYVDNRVLIPRNDTEVMVDEVLKTISDPTPFPIGKMDNNCSLIDVGTGSSCIAISVLKNIPPPPIPQNESPPPNLPLAGEGYEIDKCYVVDISKKALEVSEINIKKYKLEDKIIRIKGDLLVPFLQDNKYKLNKNLIITANLPYIKDKDYENMDSSVIKYEPKIALYGGEKNGFELYQKLINQCLELQKKHKIILFIEIGFDQKQIAEKFLNNLGLKYQIFKDNAGIDRCVRISFEKKY